MERRDSHDAELVLEGCLRAVIVDGVLRLTKLNEETGCGISLAMWTALKRAFETLAGRDDVYAIVVDAAGQAFTKAP